MILRGSARARLGRQQQENALDAQQLGNAPALLVALGAAERLVDRFQCTCVAPAAPSASVSSPRNAVYRMWNAPSGISPRPDCRASSPLPMLPRRMSTAPL
jgi:hypothetical protein